jgi:PIN domain nuclease of toxin-antitoxin system
VSAATVWELTIKDMLGKLSLPQNIANRLAAQGLSLLSITADDAEAIREYPELLRHDPFDRLLVAQAARAEMDLVTADDVLLDRGYTFVVDGRR